ncbi:MAG TPA: heparan-alpha-glucosaminide N-acetyltransferase domain-containing protein [Thermoanaerobaculia bacterium]|nr:heparan-alpha-glucosaminide N-acetyltransferase domain-containing protein [Thermoanaerobaculia bacterium]
MVPAESPSPQSSAPKSRLVSLDVFRGLTIAGMLVVNTPGTWAHVYPPLLHAEWNGWTYTDTIFPFFLFAVGVSMVFSFGRRIEKGARPKDLALHTVERAVAIFAIGLGLNVLSFLLFHKASLRIPGVLQRIGVCYLVGGILYLAFGRRGLFPAAATLLLLYAVLMAQVPVPGFGAGRLDAQGNLAAYVDRLVLGDHTWKPGWDPEGPLSTIPAIASVLAGALAGELLRARTSWRPRLVGLMASGALATTLGVLWGTVFPINKNLWTSSYALLMAGLAAVGLALCVWIVDVRGWKAWAAPFRWLGMNALAIFTMSLLATLLLLWVKLPSASGKPRSLYAAIFLGAFDRFADPRLGSLLFALAFLAVFVAVAGLLYRKRIFLKL